MKLAFWVFGCEYSVLHIKNAVGSPCWQGLKRLFFQERNLRVRCLLKIQRKRTHAYGVKTASNTLWIKQILIWIYCCTQEGFCAHIYIFTKERSAFLTGGEIKIVKWLKSSTQTRLVKQRCITPWPFANIYDVIKRIQQQYFNASQLFFVFFPESHKTNPCASTHKVTSASTSQMLDFSCGQLCFPPRFCLQQLIRVFQPSTCNWWLRCTPQ